MKAMLCAVFSLISLPCVAQATVTGQIMEPSGQVVNAKIVFTNVATHRKVKQKSTFDGTFGPVQLPAGVYKVEAKKHCLKKYSEELTLSDKQFLRLVRWLERACGPPAIME